MEFMDESIIEMVEEIFGDNPTIKKAILDLDPDIIRKVGEYSQTKLEPEYVKEAIDKGGEELENLRKKAEIQIKLKILYKSLCNSYAFKQKATKKIEEPKEEHKKEEKTVKKGKGTRNTKTRREGVEI